MLLPANRKVEMLEKTAAVQGVVSNTSLNQAKEAQNNGFNDDVQYLSYPSLQHKGELPLNQGRGGAGP